jgi:hypothetical protein
MSLKSWYHFNKELKRLKISRTKVLMLRKNSFAALVTQKPHCYFLMKVSNEKLVSLHRNVHFCCHCCSSVPGILGFIRIKKNYYSLFPYGAPGTLYIYVPIFDLKYKMCFLN